MCHGKHQEPNEVPFHPAILRTEPKCADNTEKDIHQHKTDKSYFLLQIVYTAFQYNRTLFLQRDDTRYIQLFTDSRSPIFSRKLSISSIRNPFLMRPDSPYFEALHRKLIWQYLRQSSSNNRSKVRFSHIRSDGWER